MPERAGDRRDRSAPLATSPTGSVASTPSWRSREAGRHDTHTGRKCAGGLDGAGAPGRVSGPVDPRMIDRGRKTMWWQRAVVGPWLAGCLALAAGGLAHAAPPPPPVPSAPSAPSHPPAPGPGPTTPGGAALAPTPGCPPRH